MGHWSCQRRLSDSWATPKQLRLPRVLFLCTRPVVTAVVAVFSADSTWPLMHLKMVVLCKDLVYYLCTLVLSWLVGDTFGGWNSSVINMYYITICVWLNRVNHQLFFEVLMLLIPTVEVENCYLCFQRVYSHGVVSRPPKSEDRGSNPSHQKENNEF